MLCLVNQLFGFPSLARMFGIAGWNISMTPDAGRMEACRQLWVQQKQQVLAKQQC